MDICYLINRLAPGGAPTLLLDIIQHTEDKNIEFTICFIEGDDTLAPEFREEGAQVVSFDAEFKFDPRALWHLGKFFRTHSFDIVHAHLPYAQTLGRIGTLLGDHQVVVSTQHNFQSNYHTITRTTERVTRPIDDATIAVSEAVESSFTGEAAHPHPDHEGRWRTIYNGVDVQKIAKKVDSTEESLIRERHGIPADSHIFLSVGRYVEAKRQTDLIRAFANMEEVGAKADPHLVLVGWGPLKEQLHSETQKYGIENKVTITGRVVPPWEYYAAADTFVLSSKYESFGIVLVEAMAAGLPIIAPDIPGAREVLDRANGGVQRVSSNPGKELSDALSHALKNPATVSYEEALATFNIDRTVRSHLDLYHDLLMN